MNKGQIILIIASTGRGKSFEAFKLIKNAGLEPMIVNDEDLDNEEIFKAKKIALKTKTLFGIKRGLIIEDADEITKSKNKKRLKELLIEKNPTIITLTPKDELVVRDYKKISTSINELRPLIPEQIIMIIKEKTKKNLTIEQASSLINTHNQDIRSIIIDIKTNNSINEAINTLSRNKQLSTKNFVQKLIKTRGEERKKVLEKQFIEPKELLIWINDSTREKQKISTIDLFERKILEFNDYTFRKIQLEIINSIEFIENINTPIFPKKLLMFSRRRSEIYKKKRIIKEMKFLVKASEKKIKTEYYPYLIKIFPTLSV